jgi:hypothetical protein
MTMQFTMVDIAVLAQLLYAGTGVWHGNLAEGGVLLTWG